MKNINNNNIKNINILTKKYNGNNINTLNNPNLNLNNFQNKFKNKNIKK